jgi:hypothetical protein
MTSRLPNCSLKSKASPMVYKYELDELSEFIQNLVGADCWAIVVDGEELYNDYVKKSIKDRFLDRMNRDRIGDKVKDNLLCLMKDKEKNHSLDIYMFHGPESYKCSIAYNAEIQSFVRSFWYTQKYFEKFGDDFEKNFNQIAQ